MRKTILMHSAAVGLLSLAVQTIVIAEEPTRTPAPDAVPQATAPAPSVAQPAAAQPAAPTSAATPPSGMGGGQFMTPEQHMEFHHRMMSAHTPEERRAMVTEHHRQMQERAAQAQAQAQAAPYGYTAPYNYYSGRGPYSWNWQNGYGYGPGYSYDYGYGYPPGNNSPQGYWHGYCPYCPQNMIPPNAPGPETGNQSSPPCPSNH
ncbi:exported hypothetical protein [Gammaproteobacteria bacterium]